MYKEEVKESKVYEVQHTTKICEENFNQKRENEMKIKNVL